MCGITGFIDYRKKSSESLLFAMTDEMALRGPDDSGYLFREHDSFQSGLGHRRLSILDLSPLGHQPMSFEHFDIVFNGEVYNFREIRKELSDSYEFISESDTEVVLKAWHKWGIKAVDKFRGMFAFAIFDSAKNRLTLVRDRCGIKPLFWYWDKQTFLFASELKSFHKHPAFSKQIDFNALGDFFRFGYVPQPNSIFENTFKLKSGHYLEIDLTERKISEHEYWSVIEHYNRPRLDVDEHEALERVESVLQESFDYRMVADVPVGVFLSGGYDSSIVAALLQKERSENINTFTIGFEEKEFDESSHARNVAEHLGANHVEYCCTQKDAVEIIPKLPDIYDEPFGDSSAIPTVLVSQLARKHVTVSLSADGGDELFAGYSRYTDTLDLWERLSRVPQILQKNVRALMQLCPAGIIPGGGLIENFESRYERLKASMGAKSAADILKNKVQTFSDDAVSKILIADVAESANLFKCYTGLNKNNNILDHLLAVDYQTYMQDDILAKVDRATMSVSLEGRDPLLDHKILELAAILPSNLKRRNGVSKYILKEITHKYIPKEIMERPKMGFGVPITHWFKDELKSYLNEYLDPARLKKEGILNLGQVDALKKAYFLGKNVNVQKLWFILMFEMWYERWIGR